VFERYSSEWRRANGSWGRECGEQGYYGEESEVELHGVKVRTAMKSYASVRKRLGIWKLWDGTRVLVQFITTFRFYSSYLTAPESTAIDGKREEWHDES